MSMFSLSILATTSLTIPLNSQILYFRIFLHSFLICKPSSFHLSGSLEDSPFFHFFCLPYLRSNVVTVLQAG